MTAPVVNVAVLFAILILVVAVAASGSRAQPLSEKSSDAYRLCISKGLQAVLDKCLPSRKIVLAQTEFEASTGAGNTGANGAIAGRENLVEGIAPAPQMDLMLDVPGPTIRVELVSLGVGVTWESVLTFRDTLFDVPEKVSIHESEIEAAWTGRDDTTLVNIMEFQVIGEWFGWGSRLLRSEVIFDQ